MYDLIKNISDAKQGIATGNNDYFLREWHELSIRKISFHNKKTKWYPYRKGGTNRKWYGNFSLVVNFENDGFEIKNYKDENGKLKSRPQNLNYQFKEGLTWSLTNSGTFSLRYAPENFIFDVNGMTLFPYNSNDFFYILGVFNSKVGNAILKIINPTMAFQSGDIESVPFIRSSINTSFVEQNISFSKADWDSRETSWDFETHPLIQADQDSLQSAYQVWESKVMHDFYQLHANETELNRIFIEIYGLQEELTPEVKLKDITILQEELDPKVFGEATEPVGALPIKQDVVMRQLISYLMGCLMGRYRLDKPGLHIAHPNPTSEEIVAYAYNNHTVAIDEDGIIPLMDSSCSFADNALIRLKFLLEVQWGDDKQMVETINFMEAALGKDLETFLVKDFWKDHCSRYQKRPIYWLFASPKGAFQVIAYMHRMNKYTIDKIRSKYLLVHIRNLENQLSALQADNASLNREQSKRMEKVRADLDECRAYDLLLKDVADQQIEFDLDDGVVVNYAKFAGVVVPIK